MTFLPFRLLGTKRGNFGGKTRVNMHRMDRLAVDNFYEQLSESLVLLDNMISKKLKQGKRFLTSRDQISIADLSIAEVVFFSIILLSSRN